ncbi:polyketide synthetase [Diplogelasinospora grovesii]|uniref:Polyketide synthetase n=1 Tax=Diplogelasinospora grovesii TaxID=303347 RepID=A0AAN6N2I4_9PEZI|nr:polyketide synthetase [Diplogelasinospora grovesii]
MTASTRPEPIAIISTGCRFGGSSSRSKLWDLLRSPRDVLKKIDRFNADSYYNADGHRHGATDVRHAYLIDEDYKAFDPQFFGIKPVEAECIDPVQRILLETVYEALENAGLPVESLQGSNTAFYVGIMADDYQGLMLRDIEAIPTYFATATSRSIIANRISLIALHQAVQALRSGESTVAVAGGANQILGPEVFISESKLNMLSPNGRSHMWDERANGYARGEGWAAVVLKRLDDAIRDSDHIECVIRETGTNQDGRKQMIREAYARAGLDLANPRDLPQFFEAHGTGTKAGDPIEAEAIHGAFFDPDVRPASERRDVKLNVGSIKTVVGHTEGTAGLAGAIKASLAIQNGVIPPNMHFANLSSSLKPFYGPLQITTKALPWPSLPAGVPRRASVNSFGFGGSNAHAILESYEPPVLVNGSSSGPRARAPRPLLFSADSEKSLRRTLAVQAEYLEEHVDVDLESLAWTLQARRSALPIKTWISVVMAFHSAFVPTHSLLMQWILHTWNPRTRPVLSNTYTMKLHTRERTRA